MLFRSGRIADFGALLHEGWLLKRSLSGGIATELVDDLYSKARTAGALGGKLIGAGGGGFMLFFCPQERKEHVCKVLDSYLQVPFKMDHDGAQVVHYEASN